MAGKKINDDKNAPRDSAEKLAVGLGIELPPVEERDRPRILMGPPHRKPEPEPRNESAEEIVARLRGRS